MDILKIIAIALIAGVAGGFIGSLDSQSFGAEQTNFDAIINANEGIEVDNTTVIDGSGNVTVGSNGTELATLKTGACTIWAGAQTIAATSSQQVECQSSTVGTDVAGLTGVTADSICHLQTASSTNTTLGGIVVGGVSASSTAGAIVARIVNLTGTTFTWDATASSTPKWKYTCFDPS